MFFNPIFKLLAALLLTTASFATLSYSFTQTERKFNPPFRVGNLTFGSPAPDFTLKDAQGKTSVTLSHLKGRPVVLIFGSATCGYFTQSAPTIQAFYQRYKTAAHIYMIYTREEHPNGYGNQSLMKVRQHRNLTERRQAACLLSERLKMDVPVLVDDMKNSVDQAYFAAPVRVFVVDATGHLVFSNSNPESLDSATVQSLLS